MNAIIAQNKNNFWNVLTAISLALLAFFELFSEFGNIELATYAARYCFLALIICRIPFFKLREWALIIIALFLLYGLYGRENGVSDILFALDRAAFFAGFIYLVTLLKEAAARSPSVLQLGIYLTKQIAGRRYYSLAFGGHIMGVLLNFGAVSLLTPLIQRGAESIKDIQLSKQFEQQQISALIRGFSWMILWSPTALTQAVLFTAFPQIDLHIVIPLGIGASIIMIFIGRFEEKLRWRTKSISNIDTPQALPRQATINFSIVCFTLIVSTILVKVIADVSPAIALMLTAPILMVAWLFEQEGNFQTTSSKLPFPMHMIFQRSLVTLKTLKTILIESAGVLGTSAITLGAAGFIGEAAARLAPVDLLADYLAAFNVPAWLFLISLPVIINLCGQIALSPILVVVFLSSIINQLPHLPADPNLIVFSLGAGWAMSMLASPNASATLLISGVTNIAPTTLTWRWNGRYALMSYAIFSLIFTLLTYI